jgi:hypothetical protein
MTGSGFLSVFFLFETIDNIINILILNFFLNLEIIYTKLGTDTYKALIKFKNAMYNLIFPSPLPFRCGKESQTP